MMSDDVVTSDEGNWEYATWEGNRRQQHREFLALSFREKLAILEQLDEVTQWFAARRRQRIAPPESPDPTSRD